MGEKLTNSEFINKAKLIHQGKYDYSKVKYLCAIDKVCIICHEKDEFGEEHGEFWQTPHNHITNHAGCPKCSKNHYRYNNDTFIKKASFLHHNKYDYSKINYVNGRTKICIICPEHGEFWQTPQKHLQGRGCPCCKKKNINMKSNEEFINNAVKVHKNFYDYSKVEYKGANKKVCIVCPKHGDFWQTPHHHLHGHGCPVCNNSRLENIVRNFLMENNIKFAEQYTAKWLGKQRLDFYLPELNIAIECQGEQHFGEVYYRSKKLTDEIRKQMFQNNVKRDMQKLEKCKKQNVLLLYYSDLDILFPYFVITSLQMLKEKIEELKNKN